MYTTITSWCNRSCLNLCRSSVRVLQFARCQQGEACSMKDGKAVCLAIAKPVLSADGEGFSVCSHYLLVQSNSHDCILRRPSTPTPPPSPPFPCCSRVTVLTKFLRVRQFSQCTGCHIPTSCNGPLWRWIWPKYNKINTSPQNTGERAGGAQKQWKQKTMEGRKVKEIMGKKKEARVGLLRL